MIPDNTAPGYIWLHKTGELRAREERAYRLLAPCVVCPRRCGADRLRDERGFCKTGLLPVIASYGPHFGEEPPLVGTAGSGTIFVSNCNLACCFCQNSDISQSGRGIGISCEDLAGIMVRLQEAGCHNINIVTPTHIAPQIIRAVGIAAGRGLSLPLVYNSGGCESVEMLRLLDGIVDIYMPDAKYGSDTVAQDLSHAPAYAGVMQDAIREMHRQVGDLVIRDGIAVRGLLVRHLVLPENLAGSDIVLPWIAREISPDTYVNIMAQYRPAYRAAGTGCPGYPALRRGITASEYEWAVRIARKSGLHRGF
jgi:putative pyruvate formate lyase activating enzyme